MSGGGLGLRLRNFDILSFPQCTWVYPPLGADIFDSGLKPAKNQPTTGPNRPKSGPNLPKMAKNQNLRPRADISAVGADIYLGMDYYTLAGWPPLCGLPTWRPHLPGPSLSVSQVWKWVCLVFKSGRFLDRRSPILGSKRP